MVHDVDFLGQRLSVWGAMLIALIVKWLMPDDDEALSALPAPVRRRRAMFGIATGVMCGYFGPDIVIRWVDRMSEDDRVLLAIVLVLTGEHVVRALMTIKPATIRSWLAGRIGGVK